MAQDRIRMTSAKLHFLEDRWDSSLASKLDEPELLRYRSNLLGSDLRLTNFGGGNTSSKIDEVDPLDGKTKKILWVKGSGGDLGSIQRAGFATLYLDKVLALANSYKGVAREDLRQQPGRGLDRHTAARLPAVPARRPPAPGLGHRSGSLG